MLHSSDVLFSGYASNFDETPVSTGAIEKNEKFLTSL